jgi:hypothetical protein
MSLRRRMGLLPAGIAAWAAALAACTNPTTGVGSVPFVVDSMVVPSQGVSPASERTYEYDPPLVRPDSVLSALWRAGLPFEAAWLPLDYRCEDPRGPRLTVQLPRADARMADHDFTLGTGRLGCATELTKYVPVPAGSDG